jgi:hypothetical protein
MFYYLAILTDYGKKCVWNSFEGMRQKAANRIF